MVTPGAAGLLSYRVLPSHDCTCSRGEAIIHDSNVVASDECADTDMLVFLWSSVSCAHTYVVVQVHGTSVRYGQSLTAGTT
jgi:hypothetical protein